MQKMDGSKLEYLEFGGGKLASIEYLRIYALCSLVLWHSFCIYLGWSTFLPYVTENVEHSVLIRLYNLFAMIFIPDANMPLFTAISGFVYSYLYYRKGKYRNTEDFFKAKFKRLFIPYIIIGTVVVSTISNWDIFSIFTGEAHHLWYCLMLFWCFLLIRIFQRSASFVKALIALGAITLQFCHPDIPILGVNRVFGYYAYFLFGFYLPFVLEHLRLSKKSSFLILSLWVLSFPLQYCFHNVALVIIRSYMFIALLFIFVPFNWKLNDSMKKLGCYSFGIYVFHEWFLWNMAHLNKVQNFAIEHQILYPVFAFIAIFLLSFFLTHFSLKTKLGKFLLS